MLGLPCHAMPVVGMAQALHDAAHFKGAWTSNVLLCEPPRQGTW
jgi:hypothetical protein